MMQQATEVTRPQASGRATSIAALLFAIAAVVVWFPGLVFVALDGLSGLGASSEGGPPYDAQHLLPGLVLTSVAPFALGGVALVLGLIGRRRAPRAAGTSRMATSATVMGGIASGLGLLWILLDLATDRFSYALSLL
ncbi:MAG: hypothetical protein ACTIC1_02440 [Brevibacterium sp.]